MTNPFAMTDPVPPAAPAPAAPAAPVATPAPTTPQPAQPAAPAYGDADPFANSDPAPQAARAPRFRELYGRLIILVPKKLELDVPSTRFKNQATGGAQLQDRMTADVIVCDGPTIHYGGEPEKMPPVPHTKTAEVPVKFADAFISFAGIISQCRDALAARLAGRPGMVIGRLTKGTDDSKGNPPWLLTPATDADKALGRQALAAVTADPFA